MTNPCILDPRHGEATDGAFCLDCLADVLNSCIPEVDCSDPYRVLLDRIQVSTRILANYSTRKKGYRT